MKPIGMVLNVCEHVGGLFFPATDIGGVDMDQNHGHCQDDDPVALTRRRVISIGGISELYQVATAEESDLLDTIIDRLIAHKAAEDAK